MAKITLTDEDRAFVAQGLVDFDPERHPILSVELDKIEKEIAKHIRRDALEYMRRQIRVALEAGLLLRCIPRYLEEQRLGWFVDAFEFEGWGQNLSESEVRGENQFNWAVTGLYEGKDNPLREAFSYLTYAAEARGLGDKEHERESFENSTNPAKFNLIRESESVAS